jgi:hypothetical protein
MRRLLEKLVVGATDMDDSAPHADKRLDSMRSSLFEEHVARLRQRLEDKTQALNDCSFDVTKEWLLEFASLHAEYMEKATSCHMRKHQFCSTTDLFHHVLLHPRVRAMLELWDVPRPDVERVVEGKDATLHDILNGHVPTNMETVQCHQQGDIPLATTQCQRQGDIRLATVGDVLTNLKQSGPCSKVTPNAFVPQCEAAPNPSPEQKMQPATPLQARSGNGPRRRHSVACVPASRATTTGELARKWQQRAGNDSWKGDKSPRSQRLAKAAAIKSECGDDFESPEKLASRRKLLEDKLLSCGFKKSADGGA